LLLFSLCSLTMGVVNTIRNMQRDRWSWRARAQGRAADTGSTCSAGCIVMVQEALRRITPKLVRCIGSLQRRTLMRRSSSWATCTSVAMALLETTLKRCGCTGWLLPKDILQHCTGSLPFTRTARAFLKTRRKPFTGTGAHKQRVNQTLQPLCRGWPRDDPHSPTIKPTPPPSLLHQQRTAVTCPSLSACTSHPAMYSFIPELRQLQQLRNAGKYEAVGARDEHHGSVADAQCRPTSSNAWVSMRVRSPRTSAKQKPPISTIRENHHCIDGYTHISKFICMLHCTSGTSLNDELKGCCQCGRG